MKASFCPTLARSCGTLRACHLPLSYYLQSAVAPLHGVLPHSTSLLPYTYISQTLSPCCTNPDLLQIGNPSSIAFAPEHFSSPPHPRTWCCGPHIRRLLLQAPRSPPFSATLSPSPSAGSLPALSLWQEPGHLDPLNSAAPACTLAPSSLAGLRPTRFQARPI